MITLFPMLMFILAGVIIAPHVKLKYALLYSSISLVMGVIFWIVIAVLGL